MTVSPKPKSKPTTKKSAKASIKPEEDEVQDKPSKGKRQRGVKFNAESEQVHLFRQADAPSANIYDISNKVRNFKRCKKKPL